MAWVPCGVDFQSVIWVPCVGAELSNGFSTQKPITGYVRERPYFGYPVVEPCLERKSIVWLLCCWRYGYQFGRCLSSTPSCVLSISRWSWELSDLIWLDLRPLCLAKGPFIIYHPGIPTVVEASMISWSPPQQVLFFLRLRSWCLRERQVKSWGGGSEMFLMLEDGWIFSLA